MNLFTKFFIALSVWTVGFLSLASYAGEKAIVTDPELISKIEKKFNFDLRMAGMSRTIGTNHLATQDSWTFAASTQKIEIAAVSGQISIKSHSGNDIKISANGELDKNTAPRLLETTVEGNELTVKEPANEAVKDLEIRIELPATYAQQLEIKTVSGKINIENLNLNELELKSISGDITLNQVITKELDVKTTSGNINADGLNSPQIEGKTISGNIGLSNTVPANIEFTTISGDIQMKIANKENTRYELKSTSGHIKNGLSSDKKGTLNILLTTTSGDIDLQ